ncbi:MAG: ABC transporter substrate-binding protein, partial [Pirellulales bacterium]
CDFPPVVHNKPRATHTRVAAEAPSGQIDQQVRDLLAAGEPLYDIDAALVKRLRPDIIVTQSQCDVCAVRYQDVVSLVRESAELAHTQIVSLSPNSLEDMLRDVRRVADAVGAGTAGESYIAGLQARIDAVSQRSAGVPLPERTRVVCLEWFDPLMVGGNWMPQLVRLAGGQAGLANAEQHSPTVSWEQVQTYDPEVLILMPCGFTLARTLAEAPLLQRLPDWNKLAAVQKGSVFAVDGNAYFNRSGPRLVDSLELLEVLIKLGPVMGAVPERWTDAAQIVVPPASPA